MATLDVFNNDAFSLAEMLPAIESTEYLPQRIDQLGVFTPWPIKTAQAVVESRNGELSVIKTSLRGAPLEQRAEGKRDLRIFQTKRIAKGDRINADELADIRAFGSTSEAIAVRDEIVRRLSGPSGIMSEINLTLEYLRLGCLMGEVRDVDGSKIYNWAEEWNLTLSDESLNGWPFEFSNPTFANGNVRAMCSKIVRASTVNSKQSWIPGQSYVHAFCGTDFWHGLIKNQEVRETYLNHEGASALRENISFGLFNFGGITFEQYRGHDDFLSPLNIPADRCFFFPVNAPGLFLEVFAPGESFENLDKPGERVYPKIIPDADRGFYADIKCYSYTLHVCTRPAVLFFGVAS